MIWYDDVFFFFFSFWCRFLCRYLLIRECRQYNPMELSTFRELVENLDRILTLSSNEVLWQQLLFIIFLNTLDLNIPRLAAQQSFQNSGHSLWFRRCEGGDFRLSRFELFFFFRQIPPPCQLSTSMKRRKKRILVPSRFARTLVPTFFF